MEDEIAPLLCPSEGKFKVRFACTVCNFADKAGGILVDIGSNGERYYECFCPEHGIYGGTIAENNTDIFDINTPVRALAREIFYIYQMSEVNGQNMMSDGSDWVQYATINMEALLCYGISTEKHPARFFSPMIVDEYGAKLAKSVQVGTGRYTHIPKYNIDSRWLLYTFGDSIYQVLWDEVAGWQNDPKCLFRNYTIRYFEELLRI